MINLYKYYLLRICVLCITIKEVNFIKGEENDRISNI